MYTFAPFALALSLAACGPEAPDEKSPPMDDTTTTSGDTTDPTSSGTSTGASDSTSSTSTEAATDDPAGGTGGGGSGSGGDGGNEPGTDPTTGAGTFACEGYPCDDDEDCEGPDALACAEQPIGFSGFCSALCDLGDPDACDGDPERCAEAEPGLVVCTPLVPKVPEGGECAAV